MATKKRHGLIMGIVLLAAVVTGVMSSGFGVSQGMAFAEGLTCEPPFPDLPDTLACTGKTTEGIDLSDKMFDGAEVVELVGVTATNSDGDVVTDLSERLLIIDATSAVYFEQDSSGAGVVMLGGSKDHQTWVNNFGTINVSGGPFLFGVSSTAQKSGMTNWGEIRVQARDGGTAAGANFLGEESRISNFGLVEATATVESGRAWGISFARQSGDKGTIFISQHSGDNDDGRGTIIARATNGEAVGIRGHASLPDVSITINNAGDIFATAESGVARAVDIQVHIDADASSVVSITNTGNLDAIANDVFGIMLRLTEDKTADSLPHLIANDGEISARQDEGGLLDAISAGENLDEMQAIGVGVQGSYVQIFQGATGETHASGGRSIGVYLRGDDNLVNNEGLVNASASWSSPAAVEEAEFHAAGVVVIGDDNTVSHTGTIRTGADAGGAMALALGVNAAGDGNFVDNTGSIDVQSGLNAAQDGPGRYAIGVGVSGDRNSVVNGGGLHGSVGNEQIGIRARARGHQARAVGMALSGDNSSIINQSIVSAWAAGSGSASYGMTASTQGGVGVVGVTNSGIVEASGADVVVGIAMMASPGGPDHGIALSNFGQIMANGDIRNRLSYGVLIGPPLGGDELVVAGDEHDLLGNFHIVNDTDGLIRSTSETGASIAIGVGSQEQKYESIEIHNHGTIEGDIVLGDGESTVQLHAGSKMIGNILLGSGDSELLIDEDAQFEGSIAAAGSGTVHVGRMVVGDGMRLGSTGTFQGHIINSRGTVAPGNSIGWLTIEGIYEHDHDAVLEIEIDPRELDPAKRSDRLVVIEEGTFGADDGKALLDGGTVHVQLVNGAVVKDVEQFTILTAENGVVGEFDGVMPTGTFLDYELKYTPDPGATSVVLSVERVAFASAARTANQRAVAAALDGIVDGLDDDDDIDLLGVLSHMQSGLSLDDAPATFDVLGGEVYAMAPRAKEAALSRLTTALAAGLGTVTRSEGNTAWAVRYGFNSHIVGGDGYADGHVNVRGGMAGVHLMQSGETTIGFLAGYTQSNIDAPSVAGTLRSDVNQFGLYATARVGAVPVSAVVAYERGTYDAQRLIKLPGDVQAIDRVAVARFHANGFLASVMGRLSAYQVGGMRLEPMASVTWMQMAHGPARETGAGSLNLMVDGRQDTVLQGEIGVNAALPDFDAGNNWVVSPMARVRWEHDFHSTIGGETVQFASAEDVEFTVGGAQPAAGGLRIGLELRGRQNNSALSWNVVYEADLRAGARTSALKAAVGVSF